MTSRVARMVAAAACLAAAVLLPQIASAQSAERRARISTLWPSPAEVVASYVAALDEGLSARGWTVEKADLIHYFTDGRPESLARVAGQIAATRPDAIWTPTNTGAVALQRITKSIPVVVGLSHDPVGVGLVASLARPGGNITGMTAPASDTMATRIEILKEVEPEAHAIAVLYSSHYPDNRAYLAELRRAADRFGLAVEGIALRGITEFDADKIAARSRGAQALIVLGDNITFPLRQQIAAAAIRSGLTTIAAAKEYCLSGMLLCYGYSLEGQFRQSADYVDRILRGADPAALPVQQPAVYGLTVNLGTAKALRLDMPAAMIARADEVIE
ncbi:MAG TPA: ABC transporter substrate-binding protein [Alphaproteobacteria bacterium]|nr:ABC transporter substrate-binding protein [Alphaproteobacteria bacterium]